MQPDSGTNRDKSNRTPVAVREQMLKAVFELYERLLITLNYKKTVALLREHYDVELFGIIGSDQYIRLAQMSPCPKMDVDRWCVFVREQDKEHALLQNPVPLDNASVIVVETLHYADCSSTMIRYALQDDNRELIDHLPLHAKVLHLICQDSLYIKEGC